MGLKTKLRQSIFASEYAVDLNGTRAAIAAGYSPDSATSTASELLTKPKVRKLIEDLQARRASKLQITAEKLDEETAKLAFANMGDYVRTDENGKVSGMDLSALTPEHWAAVQEIREDTTGGSGDGERKVVVRTTLKLSDKTKNLELLYRRLGLLQDNMKVSGLEGLAEKIADIRKRKKESDPT